jgi:pilus biogenesis lipoprotein CpaD
LRRKEKTMQIVRTTIANKPGLAALAVRAAVVGACAIFVCGCNTLDPQVAAVPDVPTDYRQRHPITISETDQTLEVFIGSNRGELNATQRAEVLEFAQTWKRKATGGVVVDLPVGISNERAAAEAMHTIRSLLAASGVPPNGVVVRSYQPPNRNLATIRITYPRISLRPGRAGSGRPISGRVSTAIISRTGRGGMQAVRRSATSPPWSTTPRILCSRAARRRLIECGARWSSINTGRAKTPRRKSTRPPQRRKSAISESDVCLS